ncbi:MAG TPA: TetR/AcrR family transcriptional regulator [Caulobacteraceae bacterium]|jgi:AcrR family transcriptional regulator
MTSLLTVDSRPGRTHAERRRDAEARILGAAFDIIAKRGLDHLTLADSGQNAGYSRALAAHYFGSREELVAAVARHAVSLYRDRLSLHRHTGSVGLEPLLQMVTYYLDSTRGWPTKLRAFHEVTNAALRWPSIATVVAQINTEAVERIALHVRTGQQSGEVRADADPIAEGIAISGAMRGIMNQWLVAPDNVDLDRVRDGYVATLRRGLTGRP